MARALAPAAWFWHRRGPSRVSGVLMTARSEFAAEEARLAQEAGFALRLTPAMRQRLDRPGVATQFLPDPAELHISPESLADPIGDEAHSPVPGLTHRYPDRVILRVTLTCAVHCRFCFRREVVGDTGPLAPEWIDAALDYIAARPSIREVILTGGDPLTLSERRLTALMGRLSEIPHLDNLRIHSRIPVVDPARITPALVRALGRGKPCWLVLHVNHADEITPAAEAALGRLARGGVALLSQSVLLRGVNADVATLESLFRRLVTLRVKPYYLHHCDLARGAAHFRTTIEEGQMIMSALRGRLSGIAQPTYVLDIPGGHGKVPVGPGYLAALGPGRWQVRDPNGGVHAYSDPGAP